MSANLRRGLLIGLGLVALLLVVWLSQPTRGPRDVPTPHKPDEEKPDATAGSYLFCFWNLENLFDDVDDKRKSKGDPEYDHFFGHDPDALKYKLAHLADVLIPLNDGRGPDLLGVCEVESERAARLLADTLNKRLGKEAYAVVFKQSGSGRHISPALLTKLPVVGDRTDVWGNRQRILKTVVRVNGHDLMVVVSHWTSRLTDKEGKGRKHYADAIYGQYKAAFLAARREGKDLDFLLCGDFNDNPDDVSVAEHLHATGDLARVKAKDEPLLFDLMAKPYADGRSSIDGPRKKNFIFDHLCVSPGMFDDVGWSCDPGSATIVTSFANNKGMPNRFGGPNDKRPFSARGASDHFPVSVKLLVR